MEHIRKILSFSKQRWKDEETSEAFMRNGSVLLEELITCFNGRHNIPIRSFTTRELIRATNNFAERVNDGMFRGYLEERPILVKKLNDIYCKRSLSYAINDIVITSQMSQHKNVLKLLGCCLEFEFPAMVYEYAGTELLPHLIYKHNDDRSLPWGNRLRIANDIANAILYLHTAFPTAFIYRDLKPQNVIIDQCGVAKLFDFSLSISLPRGELQVEDDVIGMVGFLDPEYYHSHFLSQKSDVYSFGVLLLVLLTGQNAICRDHEGNRVAIVDYVIGHADKGRFIQIMDSKISDQGCEIELEQQMQAFLALALKCVQKKEDRPEMIEVARELRQIKRSARVH